MTDPKSPSDIAKVKRKIARTAVTREGNSANERFKEVTSESRDDAEAMIAKLKRLKADLTQADEKLLELVGFTDEDLEKELERQSEYSDFLGDTIDRLEVKLRRVQAPAQPQVGSRDGTEGQTEQQKMKVKHQKLELTSYDGDPLAWEEFWDDFTLSVDSRSDLTVIDKFKLLKQSLKGDAQSVVSGYSLTQRNYQEVKDSLKERFGDPQVAIFAHFEALIELSPASHEVDQLIRIRDRCEAHIRSLTALGLTEEAYGLVFAPIILSKLPRFVKLEMHRRNGSKRWTLAALRDHLKDEIQARTKSDRQFAGTSDRAERGQAKGAKGDKGRGIGGSLLTHGSRGKNKGFPAGGPKSKSIVCVFCQENHQNWECQRYPTAESRLPVINGRCYNCLSDKHMKRECQSQKKCYYCGVGRHHSSLCYKEFGKPFTGSTPNATPHSAWFHSAWHAASFTLVQNLNPDASEFVPAHESATSVLASGGSKRNSRTGMAILESAVVPVQGLKGSAKARVVFDNGSTLSFARTKFARGLGAKIVGHDSTMLGRFGEDARRNLRHALVQVELVLRDGSTMRILLRQEDNVSAPMRLSPIPLDEICQRFRAEEFTGLVKQPSTADIDILIGLDYYYDIPSRS